jgi:hypothetical protein
MVSRWTDWLWAGQWSWAGYVLYWFTQTLPAWIARELGIIREHHEDKLLHLNRKASFAIAIASSVELNVVKATTGPKFLLGIHTYHLFLSTLLVEYSILQQGLLRYQLHHQLQLHFFTNIDIVKVFIALCFETWEPIIVSGSSGFLL